MALLFCSAMFCAESLCGQSPGGVHPHVGPLAYGLQPLSLPQSPQLNIPNGQFDNGEAPVGTTPSGSYSDQGGMLGFDVTPPQLGVHAHAYIDNAGFQGWRSLQVPPVQVFQGYFQFTNAATPPLASGAQVVDGGFEVVAETTYQVGKPTLLLIYFPGTIGFAAANEGVDPDFGRFAYPGWGFPAGTSGIGGDRAAVEREEALGPLGNFNLISASAPPRLAGRPLAFELQRAVQLVQVVGQMLRDTSTPSLWRPANWTPMTQDEPLIVVSDGGSYGGFVAQASTLLFPQHFHGAFSTVSWGSMRRAWQEQELWRYLCSLSGFWNAGREYRLLDTLQTSAGLWHYRDLRQAQNPGQNWSSWSPFFHASITRSWNDGRLVWPVYYLVGDEDAVTTGTDWLPLFDGTAGYHRAGHT